MPSNPSSAFNFIFVVPAVPELGTLMFPGLARKPENLRAFYARYISVARDLTMSLTAWVNLLLLGLVAVANAVKNKTSSSARRGDPL